jgi:hypothetical protein
MDEEIAGWKEWAAMAEARIEELEAALARLARPLAEAIDQGLAALCICGRPGAGSAACRACSWIIPGRTALAALTPTPMPSEADKEQDA